MRAGKVGAVVKGGASGSALGWLGACRSRTGGWEVGWAGRLGARWGDKGVATAEFASEGGRGGGGARQGATGPVVSPRFSGLPLAPSPTPFPAWGVCVCVHLNVSVYECL